FQAACDYRMGMTALHVPGCTFHVTPTLNGNAPYVLKMMTVPRVGPTTLAPWETFANSGRGKRPSVSWCCRAPRSVACHPRSGFLLPLNGAEPRTASP